MIKSIARSVIVLACLTGFTPAAWATAIYSTSAGSSFAMGGADGVVIGSSFGSKTEIGIGMAGYGHAISGAGVMPAGIGVSVGGSASSPPFSLASSTYMAGHIIMIDNTHPGAHRISVPFTFGYVWTTAISIDHPVFEFASSGAFFGISGFEPGIDSINIDGDLFGDLTDTPGTSAWLFNPTYATSLAETGGFGGAGISGVINVEAGMFGMFSVITDASGLAVSDVPEPGTLTLLGSGLLGLASFRRRRLGKRSRA